MNESIVSFGGLRVRVLSGLVDKGIVVLACSTTSPWEARWRFRVSGFLGQEWDILVRDAVSLTNVGTET